MSQIFISYSKEDVARAQALAEKLSEYGWPVWWDRQIPIGKTFDEVIEEKLKAAQCVIVLWTATSVRSDWVKIEADEGRKRGVLVPVRMDPVDIPLGFRRMQFADLSAWDECSDSPELQGLVAAVAALVGGPGVPPRTELRSEPACDASDATVASAVAGVRRLRGERAGAGAARSSSETGGAESRSRFGPLRVAVAAGLLVLAIVAGVQVLPASLRFGPDRPEADVSLAPYSSPGPSPSTVDPQRRALQASARDADPGGMVAIPGGTFLMGCNEKVDDECDADEMPGRTVEVKGFWIDRTEVEVAEYAACVAAGGCNAEGATDEGSSCNWRKARREQHPMNCVDWEQARAYCAWTGKRLPTEAEWEKAARGIDGRKYPWGNNWDNASRANIDGDDDGYKLTAPVGLFPSGASPYGVLDMAGNVWEWVDDGFGDNGRGVRGGSRFNLPRNARTSYRNGYDPRHRGGLIGFRCAQ